MEKSPLISIVIPVYNVEGLLERCVYSIINQKYYNYEIILIDDGSTDSSGRICDSFASQFDNIKALHYANEGVSKARNKGVEISQGEYIIFMDSDDYWCDDNILNKFQRIIEESDPDIIRGEYKAVDLNGNTLYQRTELPGKKEHTNKIIDNVTLLTQAIQGEYFLFLYLFKKNIISRIKMDVQFTCYEDIDFLAKLFATPHKNYYILDVFYAYTKRPNTLSSNINLRKLQNSFSLCYTFHGNATKIHNQPALLDYYKTNSIMMYYWSLKCTSNFDNYKQLTRDLNVEQTRKDVLKWMKDCKPNKKNIIIYINPIIACKYFRGKKYIYDLLHKLYKIIH